MDRVRPNFALTNFSRGRPRTIGPLSAKIGRHRPNLGRFMSSRPDLDRPNSTTCDPKNQAEVDPKSGSTSTQVRRHRDGLGAIWSMPAKLGREFANWLGSTNSGPISTKPGRSPPNLGRNRAAPGRFRPISDPDVQQSWARFEQIRAHPHPASRKQTGKRLIFGQPRTFTTLFQQASDTSP